MSINLNDLLYLDLEDRTSLIVDLLWRIMPPRSIIDWTA